MRRHLTLIVLALTLASIITLSMLGIAVWVFIPLLPAAVLLIVILTAGRHRPAEPEVAAPKAFEESHESDEDMRKAA